MKVSTREFDRMVERAIGRIPDEIRRALENVLISVVPEPDPDLLEELGMAPDESLMGLYQGVSLAERSVT
ncbi:MAG: metallopeptidase family protein, partial [Desulfobacteraceae bacterium]